MLSTPFTPPPPPSFGQPRFNIIALSTEEQKKWIDTLSFSGNYPKDEMALLMMGINREKANTPIPEEQTKDKEKIERYFRDKICRSFSVLLAIRDRSAAQDVFKKLNIKAAQCKTLASGLDIFHYFLIEFIEKIRQTALEKALTDDPELQKHLRESWALREQFQIYFTQYADAPTDDLWDQMSNIIQKMKTAQKEIIGNERKVNQCKEQLIKVRSQQNVCFIQQEKRIVALENEINRLKRRQQHGLGASTLEETEKKLKELKEESLAFMNDSDEISVILQQLEKEEEAQLKVNIFRSLYKSPKEWTKLNQAKDRISKKHTSKEPDMTCMGNNPAKRKLEIGFFDIYP